MTKFGTIPEITLELQGGLSVRRDVTEAGKIGFDEGLQKGFIGVCFSSRFMTLLQIRFFTLAGWICGAFIGLCAILRQDRRLDFGMCAIIFGGSFGMGWSSVRIGSRIV